MDLKFGFPVLKNLYTREIRRLNCILWTFYGVFVILLLACAETPLILLPVQNGPQIRIPRAENLYTREIRRLNCILRTFYAFFVILLLRMRRNTINSTSGFKMDLKFGFLVPKNIYMCEIMPKRLIWPFFCSILRCDNTHGILAWISCFSPN